MSEATQAPEAPATREWLAGQTFGPCIGENGETLDWRKDAEIIRKDLAFLGPAMLFVVEVLSKSSEDLATKIAEGEKADWVRLFEMIEDGAERLKVYSEGFEMAQTRLLTVFARFVEDDDKDDLEGADG